MRHCGETAAPAKRRETSENLRFSGASGERDISQVLQGCHLILGRFGCDLITHARVRIQPKSRRSLETPAQRYENVRCHIPCCVTDLLRFCPVNIDKQLGLIEW